MKRIYIAGPMTGYPDMNFPAFNQAAETLRYNDWEIINPVDINPDPKADWLGCMRKDIKALCDCDAIYLLNGWEKSEGANAEYQVARILKLKVYFES